MPSTWPTIVIVHDGCSDATTWFGVIAELHRRGLTVLAAANPLRGLAHDAAYVSSVVAGIDGPVVLVGHAYGGAVITQAGAAPGVVALVYVSAYLPAEGESYQALASRFAPAPILACLRRTPLGRSETALASGPAADAAVDSTALPEAELTVPADAFRELVAADLDPEVARALAAVQRPMATRVFSDVPTVAAWRHKPAWALVTGADQALPPQLQRFTADRADATVLDLPEACHAVAVSQPTAVAEFIHDAARVATGDGARAESGTGAGIGTGIGTGARHAR
ncbi:alpha/beta hydrolase [Streptomyces sp. NPDC046203]|uniref:alpha/beta fold hydrolase n=1 Tax=Streptomyces sp. NPDC046203 TaxID=3154602 RepID=UPI0033C3D545